MPRSRMLRNAALLACVCALLAGCTPGDQPAGEAPASGATDTAASPSSVSQTRAPSTRSVIAETLPYADVNDELVYGHFTFPEDMIDPLPAVIMIHDWWGLNSQMRSSAERLASEGYIVLGVDLFQGDVAETPTRARDLEIDVVENPDRALENLRQAQDFIRNTAGAPSLAIVGFGFGGGWTLNAALAMPGELQAAVSYYGQIIEDPQKLDSMDTPILGMFAQGDRVVPPSAVNDFETTLESLGKDFEIHIYREARRGFADELSENFDARIDADAFNRLLEFLEPRMSVVAE